MAIGTRRADDISAIAPCSADSAFHVVDLWVGTWNAVDSTGAVVGTDRVEKILDECTVTETRSEPSSDQGRADELLAAGPMRIVVTATTARLYVNGADPPCLIVNDLRLGEGGGQIALWSQATTDAYFATVTAK